MSQGSITVVGTGIQAAGQVTIEARNAICQADMLLYLVVGGTTIEYLKGLNPNCESLAQFYGDGKDRGITYGEMVDKILSEARAGQNVCVALYGHPGVFAKPTHEAIRRARAEGIRARMLPGISAEDCLFADLGVEPGIPGLQSFEATDFLVHSRGFDTTSQLVLWQIGVIGDVTYRPEGYDLSSLQVLVDRLLLAYDSSHEVTVYEASLFPIFEPRIEKVALRDLPSVAVTPISTLYIPPGEIAEPNPAMLELFNLGKGEVGKEVGGPAASVFMSDGP